MRSTKWVDPFVEACGFGRYQLQVLVYGGAGYLASATIFVILGAVVRDLPSRRWEMSEIHAGLLQSALFVGAVGGTLAGGPLSDCHGRRICILASYLVFFAAVFLLVSAQGYSCMVSGCLLFGFAGGVGLPAFNTLLVEISPAGRRGDLLCLASAVWFLGEIYGAVCVWLFRDFDLPWPGQPAEGLHWRACLIVGFLPSVILCLHAVFRLRESPRFLAAHGRVAESRAILAAMADTNAVQLPASVQGASLCDSEHDQEVAESPTTSLELVVNSLSRWPLSGSTMCLMIICVVCNLIYYGLIFSLPLILYERAGSGMPLSPAAQLFVVTLFKLPGILLAFVLLRVHSIGHKVALASLFAAMVGSSMAFPAFLSMEATFGYLSAACVLKLTSSTAFILVYIFALEVYPTSIRSTGMALCAMAGRIGSISCGPLYLLTTTVAGSTGYFMMIAACASFAVSVSVLAPQETKGKPLAEDDEKETCPLMLAKAAKLCTA